MEPPPSLESIISSIDSQPDSPLAVTLKLFLEPSPVLISTVVPQLHRKLSSSSLSSPLRSYSQLIDYAMGQVRSMDVDLQAQFIAGHPRIGETKNNLLSAFSLKEQQGTSMTNTTTTATTTSPAVLARLAHLNACYERRYPNLVYIIFVNGRSRELIVRVLEDHLGLEHSLSTDEPDLGRVVPVEIGSKEWLNELERAVGDVGLIAKSRIRSLGLE